MNQKHIVQMQVQQAQVLALVVVVVIPVLAAAVAAAAVAINCRTNNKTQNLHFIISPNKPRAIFLNIFRNKKIALGNRIQNVNSKTNYHRFEFKSIKLTTGDL